MPCPFMNTVLGLSVLFGCLRMVWSASSGAKDSACADMFPAHSGLKQQTPPPFKIQLTSATYGCQQSNITVSIKSNDLEGFRGYLCQPRTDVDTYRTYGHFEADNSTNNCIGEEAVTHTEASLKTSVSFIWVAPKEDVGTVYIVCTVVRNWAIFWHKISSEGIRFSNNCSLSSISEMPSSTSQMPSRTSTKSTSTEATSRATATMSNSSVSSTSQVTVSAATHFSTESTGIFTNRTNSSVETTLTNRQNTTASSSTSMSSSTSITTSESSLSSTGGQGFSVSTVASVFVWFLHYVANYLINR